MAKVPSTEHFRITCEVEASAMGPIVAQLTRMGLSNINFELVTKVQSFRQRLSHDVNGEDFLQEWIKDHPTFRAIEAVKYFAANGRNNGGCYKALRELTDKKILRKLSPGNYQRADIKALAAPKRDFHEVDHREFVLRALKQHKGHITREQLKTHFERDGRKLSSIGGALFVLQERGLVKYDGKGSYMLTKAKPKKKKSNGAAKPVTEEAHAQG